ncbi:MAG: hypothetical protein DRZ79_00905 [Candidatus Cloacimonadota bacterium]|nr:MAG: hypothetical protein DRZ79_00905 [Candidatus Cloacimonadota bacterium]
MLKINDFSLFTKGEQLFSIKEMRLESGKMAVVFGNNDTGKSLFLRTIHGDYFDFKGDIYIKENPAIFYKKRKKTILIENAVHLLPQKTIWENIIIPLPKISSKTKEKIADLANLAGLGEIYGTKVEKLSFSSQKFIELIRAAIQTPYLILIDDFDNFFDEIKLIKATEILNHALKNGTSIVATAKTKPENFQIIYRIQNKEMVKL